MGINIGNHPLDNCKLGSQQVEVIYLGENEVWSFIKGDRLFVYFSNAEEMREINKENGAVINSSEPVWDLYYDLGGVGRRLFAVYNTAYRELSPDTLAVINSATGAYNAVSVGGTGKTLLFSTTARTMQVNPDNFSLTEVASRSFTPFIDGLADGSMFYWDPQDDDGKSSLFAVNGVDAGSPAIGTALASGGASRDIGGTRSRLFTLADYSIDERNPQTGAVIRNFGDTNYRRMGGTK